MFERDVHVHVPAGAIPKDGPSAGIAMATALVSALSGRPARHDVAMTGETTLSGRVLPIGGLKEKVLGAVRAGITHIGAPRDNEPDLDDLPPDVRSRLTVSAVDTSAPPSPSPSATPPAVGTPTLSGCGDLVRAMVRERRNQIGFGRVNVTVDAVGKRGHALVVKVLGVEAVFSRESGFSACVESALRREVPILASSDYALRARVHLCVGPKPLALKLDAP